MKNKFLISFFACMLVMVGYGQGLKLINNSSVKNFNTSKVFWITVPEMLDKGDVDNKNFVHMRASIIEVKADSIMVNVSKDMVYQESEEMKKQNTVTFALDNIRMIAQNDILRVEDNNAYMKKKVLRRIGVILITGGVFTGVNTLIFSKEGHRKNLLIASAIQISTGITLGVLSKRKKYYFKKDRDPWRFAESME